MALKISKRTYTAHLFIILIGAVGISAGLLWAYNLGSVTYSETNARAYIMRHCELVGNQYGKYWECAQ